MVARIDRILHERRALLLSVDEGLEEGPGAFSLTTVDPGYIVRIALEGHYTGIVVNPGIAEKYMTTEFREVPLIVNLNAKTGNQELDPHGKLLCTVERAVKLGAQAVAFTLYDGNRTEPSLFEQFGRVVEHAHDYGIPVIAWMHHRDHHASSTERDAYAARLALELGADAVSLRYNGDRAGFEWIVKCAGRCAVLVTESKHPAAHDILTHAQHAVHAGAIGAVYGKSVWGHAKPFSLTRALSGVIFKDKPVDEALKYLA